MYKQLRPLGSQRSVQQGHQQALVSNLVLWCPNVLVSVSVIASELELLCTLSVTRQGGTRYRGVL